MYGHELVFDSFFADVPPIEKSMIGGWMFRGHDERDEYQEFVIRKPVIDPEDFDLVRTWIDWVRHPIPKGNVLLADIG